MAEYQTGSIQPIPSHLGHLLHVNIEYQVVVCLGNGCRKAVSTAGTVEHLRKHHHVTVELRKQAERYMNEFPIEYDYSTIRIPVDGLAPQDVLPIIDGFRCVYCGHKTQNRKVVKQHGAQAHGKKRAKDEDLYEVVRLQSWFQDSRQRYWVVDENKQPAPLRRWVQEGDTTGDTTGDMTSDSNVHIAGDNAEESEETSDADTQIIEGIEKWKTEAKERKLTLSQKAPAIEADSWLQFTRWNSVLSQSKHNIIETHHFTRLPDEDEPDLRRVLCAWDRVVSRCLDTLAATDHMDILKWWVSPKNEEASQRPFELPQNTKTVTKYSGLWQRFICYILRTAPRDAHDHETETGVRVSSIQQGIIMDIRQRIEVVDPEPEISEEQEEEEEGLLTSAVMRLAMAVIMQDISRMDIYGSPLMHFLAVMGVDPVSGKLRPAFFYTPVLAGILWINRLIMLEVAVPVVIWPELGLTPREENDSIGDHIHQIRRSYLCQGSFSPTSSILSQLAMGKAFNKIHVSNPNIHWNEEETAVYYGGRGVFMDKVRMMCQELIMNLGVLMKRLTFDVDMPVVDLRSIVDSVAWTPEFQRYDYSFINHMDNRGKIDAGWQRLYHEAKKAVGDAQMLKKNAEGQLQWIDHRVEGYLTQETRFLKQLMVTCHITGGQPARGPELGSIKVSNSVYSARNLYVINGRICFLTMYDKARARRGNTEYILRHLPDEVSQILAQYLIYVRPFARMLDHRESEYLFGDQRGPWAGEELTEALSVATSKYLEVRLTVSAWRHVAIAIAVRHLIRASKTWDKDEGLAQEEDEFATGEDEQELEEATFQHIMIRQSGHGARVAQNHYAIDGAFLHRLGPELMSTYERASVAWHIFMGLQSDGMMIKTEKTMEKMESMERMGRIERMERMERMERIERIETAPSRSQEGKHRRNASQQLIPTSIKRSRQQKVGRDINGQSEDSQPKYPSMISKRIQRGLEFIYGPGAQARSEGQAAALQVVHQPPKASIIVLPTSSGKSVLFFSVAAVASQQTVVVVVPFTALIQDIIERGLACGLRCEEWVDERSGGDIPQLVVVSADRAIQGAFLHYAKGLELRGQLAHMFFDECHVAFTDTSYRERLGQLWALRYLGCPFTCLTATLMVDLEGVLRDRLCIQQAQLFRRPTARPTIEYQVVDSQDSPASSIAIEMIRKIQLGKGKRGVIYVRSYGTGGYISKELACAFYKARTEGKAELLDRWVHEDGGWIVATGALGTGINIEGITHVIHVDRPYGLTSFAQQSGRGGRNGEISKSIIVVRAERTQPQRRREITSVYSVEQVDEDAMTEYIQVKGCRREVLSRYFDGLVDDVDCRGIDGVLCDWCRGHVDRMAGRSRSLGVGQKEDDEEVGGDVGRASAEATEEGGNLAVGRKLQELVRADEEMIEVMDQFKRGCLFCAFEYGEGDIIFDHIYMDCRVAGDFGLGFERYQQWRAGIDLGELIHCYQCGLSQRLCGQDRNRRACEYMDIILPGIFILEGRESLKNLVEDEGFRGDMSVDLWDWMNEKAEGFGVERESNLMGTWRLVCRRWRRWV